MRRTKTPKSVDMTKEAFELARQTISTECRTEEELEFFMCIGLTALQTFRDIVAKNQAETLFQKHRSR